MVDEVEKVLRSYRMATDRARGLVPQLTKTVERLEKHVKQREELAAQLRAVGGDDDDSRTGTGRAEDQGRRPRES